MIPSRMLRSMLLGLLIWSVADVPLDASDEFQSLVGWATEGDGTTGGTGGSVHAATNAERLQQLMDSDEPQIIEIHGHIVLSDVLRVPSNTTLMGIGLDARLTGGGLHLRRVHNIIIRNLTITEALDAINIEESHHIWIDHCDLSRCRDGLLDIKRGSDFITVSWNHFHDHHKTCLLGHSDKDDIREGDVGHLRVTYHHNYFDGTETRHPRVRFAEGVHVFNNYYRGNEYGVASVMDAGVLVEGNVFEDVEHPTFTSYGDSPAPGRLVARDNLLIRSGDIETRGRLDDEALTYSYDLDPVELVRERVVAGAGVSEPISEAIRP